MKFLFPQILVLSLVPLAFAQTPVPGRLLVGFRANVLPSQAQAVISAHGARSSRQIGSFPIHIVELPPAANANAVANAFRGRAEVQFTESDMLLPPVQVTPNDPSYSSQWHLPKIEAPSAWLTSKGSSAIQIAILDTGVDPGHSDLYTKLVSGWNFFDNNSDSRDVYGHGTKVAGTAAALSNNGIGGAGVSWNSLIMPIRVTDASGYATYSDLAAGLIWAADRGARVANMSFDVTGSSTVSSAAQYFQSKGGVVVSSAGNSGTASTLAPSPYIITVSATDPNDAIYSWSTTGNRVTLSAPGCVFTTFNGNTYGSACGTSFSSPVVAGVAALLLATNPNLTPAQVVAILQSSSDDLGSIGLDPIFGYGRVNANKALAMAFNPPSTNSGSPAPTPTPVPTDTQAPVIRILSPAAGTFVSSNLSVTFSATDNVGVTKVQLLVNGNVVGTSSTAPFTIRWNTTKITRGSYTLQGKATDAKGNVGLSTTIMVYR
ncbi:MAG: S8 family serine peptidase [Acidobacteria bacterium]|nr:S8 family serine peptidase [Acidobacteriota bacterium]